MICSIRGRGKKKEKPEECLGCDQNTTPPFPKIEEQIGRVCQSILLKLIQILEGVETAMLSRKPYREAACQRCSAASRWDSKKTWLMLMMVSPVLSLLMGEENFKKVIYVVLNLIKDSHRELHEVTGYYI